MKTQTLKALHNRATMAASVLVAALVACIVFYLMAVEKGALPSVTTSLIQKPTQLVVSNPPPAKVVTVAAVPKSASASLTAIPLPVAPSAAPDNRAKPGGAQVQKQDTVSTDTPNPTNSLGPVRSPNQMMMTTPPTAEDERVARMWLEEATNRPAIRVRYNPNDILRLVELQRGLFVVGSGDTNNQREFYLASKPNTAPLFDRLTKAILNRFSTYSLALNTSSAFEPLTTSLPAYFPDTNYEFSFVPDQPLAVEIFSQIACANRSLAKESIEKRSPIFEGQLRLNGQQPEFQLLEVTSGNARHLIRTAQDLAPR